MKQSADDGVYDPSLITLLDSIPKDVDSTPIKEKKSTPGNVTPSKVTPASAKVEGGKKMQVRAKVTPASVKSKEQKRRKRRARRARR